MTASISAIHRNLSIVPQDPREQPVSAEAVDALALAHRPEFDPLTPEQAELLDVQSGLENLMARYGAKRVLRLVKFLAAINGEEV